MDAPAPHDETLRRALDGARTYIAALPTHERHVATLAADGVPIWSIAQETGESEAAVARTIDAVFAAVTGRVISPVETGGLGSDTDPGVTGGYGDTGFGGLDTEPVPDNTEPTDGQPRG